MTPDHPRRIGPYRLVEKLGEGGMGVVYLAEQSEPVRRTAALKILKPGGDSDQVLRRFEAERQALAVMDHPSIAKIFDAGVTPDGRSYFVMERVEGIPLTEYCDQRRLTIRDRVKLFVDVCQAVQHAHHKGVIHRDLKPSNVLVSEVDGRPLPRIIDFGVAKATGSGILDGTRMTAADQIVGTPAYMSPEQVEGSDDIDTRSDVYALGVLLYEVLVGALPYDPSAYRGWAALAATLHRDPATPAVRFAEQGARRETLAEARSMTALALQRELAGDTGWIAMRAMEKDRDQRYETAHAMAADLGRLLDHQPVRARRATSAYVVGRFVRRNRLAVAFGTTVVVGLLGFTAVTAVQAERVARARDEADLRRAQAEGLIDFMLTDLRSKLEPLGQLAILEDVGTQAARYFGSMPADRFSDAELASRSQSLYQIGRVLLDKGEAGEAAGAFTESLRLARELSDRAPADAERLFGLSQSHFYMGYSFFLAGELAPAEASFQEYLDAAERLVRLDPDKLEYHLEVGFAHGNLGSVREARGDLDGAAEAYTQTLMAKQALVDRDSTNIDWVGELAETYNKLAVVNRKRGRYADAAEGHTLELALKRRILGASPGHAYWRYRSALALGFLAEVRLATGQAQQALRLLTEETAVLDSLVGHDPANTRWRRARALIQERRATALVALERHAEAAAVLEQGEREIETLVRRDSTAFRWRVDLAAIRTTQARALLGVANPRAALARADGAVALVSAEVPSSADAAVRIAGAYLTRGDALAASGRPDEATSVWERGLAVLQPFASEANAVELRPLRTHLLLALGRLDEARLELSSIRKMGYLDRHLERRALERGVI